MKKTFSLILLIALLVTLSAALFGCGSSAAEDIKGIYMTSAGVILVSDEKLAVKVYDRHGELIYDKLAKINTDAYPLPDICVTGKNAYILEFERLAEISAEGSYKCRYSVKGESSYIEHTYIVSATPAEQPDILAVSAETDAETGFAWLTVSIDPAFARLFKVWTDDVPDYARFPSNALDCVSGYDQIAQGEMVYEVSVPVGHETVFYTRGLYNLYGYEADELLKVNNADYPDFVSACVCLDLLNPEDDRVFNLGNTTHMTKFTIYSPSDSTELARVNGTPPPAEPEPPVFTAELVAEGGKAKLKVTPYPNAVYYRAVITEHCNGKTRTVCNTTLTGKLVASANIRTDAAAVYTGSVYGKLADGTLTEKLELDGFETSFVQAPTPAITYENGEVKAVFPRNAKVTVWRSGADVSTDTLVIGSGNVYTYMPDGPGEYGFIFKAFGNGAEILDSGLIKTETVKIE